MVQHFSATQYTRNRYRFYRACSQSPQAISDFQSYLFHQIHFRNRDIEIESKTSRCAQRTPQQFRCVWSEPVQISCRVIWWEIRTSFFLTIFLIKINGVTLNGNAVTFNFRASMWAMVGWVRSRPVIYYLLNYILLPFTEVRHRYLHNSLLLDEPQPRQAAAAAAGAKQRSGGGRPAAGGGDGG